MFDFLKKWHKKITSPIFLENDVGGTKKRKKTVLNLWKVLFWEIMF